MKVYLILIIVIFSNEAWGQSQSKPKGKPKTLEETFIHLDVIFNELEKYNFMKLPEDFSVVRQHFGIGMQIRNRWGLWRNTKLQKYFVDRGITHGDNMSAIILTSYHRHLNNKPIDLEGQIKRYHDYEKAIMREGNNIIYPDRSFERTPDSVLVKFFPVGDTVLVDVGAVVKSLFSSYLVNAPAIAVVREHKEENLIVEILKIASHRRITTQLQVGDLSECAPISCNLIPPSFVIFKKEE